MTIITNSTGAPVQPKQAAWTQKTAIKTFQAPYATKFDMESDAIDLRKMAENYTHGIIPCEDIHQGLLAVLGPNYSKKVTCLYDPNTSTSYSPKFTYVNWDQLYLYSIFQRDIAPKHVAKLFRDWDHTAMIVPCAIKFTWKGKTYYCIWDGHHTIQTAKLMGYTQFPVWYIDIDDMPSSVITAAQFTDDEEGRINYGCWLAGRNMIRINALNKRFLEHYDRYMILLETKDAKAMQMDRIITATGCIAKRKAKTAGSWTQINAGEECYDLVLGNGLPSQGVFWKHALEFHRSVWNMSPLVLEVFRPLSYLYQAFNVGSYVIDAQFDTELEALLTSKYGDAESVHTGIKASHAHAVEHGLGRGNILKNDREIVYNGLINLYNQNCGRLVAIPQAEYVWSV